ncbi:MAG: hypothetical protein ACLTBV_10580 [Enterocloster bolteae]
MKDGHEFADIGHKLLKTISGRAGVAWRERAFCLLGIDTYETDTAYWTLREN